jgi:hypothetical protein
MSNSYFRFCPKKLYHEQYSIQYSLKNLSYFSPVLDLSSIVGYGEPGCWVAPSGKENGAGIFKHSMEAGNRVVIGLSYRPSRLHSLAELVLGLLKSLKIRAQVGGKMHCYKTLRRIPPPWLMAPDQTVREGENDCFIWSGNFYWICKKCLSPGYPLPIMWISGSFSCHFYFEAFTEFSCISTAECPAPEAGRHFLHGGMSNTSMGEIQNVPAPREGFFYSQICNFPEESFILSSPCNSVDFWNGIELAMSNKYVNFWSRNRLFMPCWQLPYCFPCPSPFTQQYDDDNSKIFNSFTWIDFSGNQFHRGIIFSQRNGFHGINTLGYLKV